MHIMNLGLGSVCARHSRSRIVASSRLHHHTSSSSWRSASRSSPPAITLLRLRASTTSPSPRSTVLYQRRHHDDNSHQSLFSRCFASTNGLPGGGYDDDAEWMPPDHSPLAPTNETFPFEEQQQQQQQQPSASTYNPMDLPNDVDITPISLDEITEDEIEVIDLEATMNNQYNQQLLQEEWKKSEAETSSSSESGFEAELEDVGWKEILKELRNEGKTDIMDRLVNEYNLQGHLDALDEPDVEENDISESSEGGALVNSNDDEWDEEFDQSLQGLSQEELIDELVENSLELSELEMEIISQEMERAELERKGGIIGEGELGGGLDYESLDDSDLSDNAAYRDFRAMVLEDYQEKKRARMKAGGAIDEGKKKSDPTDASAADAITNWSTKEDLSVYPPDWKDYDSSGAFQRDFATEDDDSWVPPSEEFIPSSSHEKATNEGKKNPPKDTTEEASTSDNLDNTIDWLQARRSRLGEDEPNTPRTPTHLMTPQQADSFRHQNSQIPVILHTLPTTTELSESLSAQGGTDIHIIDTTEFTSKQGVGPGCKYIMLITGRNSSHIRVLAESVVRNLKARKLSERGVMGAMQGAEGGSDVFSNKQTRNRARRNGAMNVSGKIDDEWIVVDCDNIHVHLLEETTRRCLNIEGLWDLSNPNSDGSKLRNLDCEDDDAVDTYVAEHPIPDEYAAKIFNVGGRGRTDGWISGGMPGGRVQSVPIFQKKSFSEKWSGEKSERSKRAVRRGRRASIF